MKTQSTVSGFCYVEIEYAMQYTDSYTSLIHLPILKPIGDETQSTVSGFCYARNRVCYAVYLYLYLLINIPILKPFECLFFITWNVFIESFLFMYCAFFVYAFFIDFPYSQHDFLPILTSFSVI